MYRSICSLLIFIWLFAGCSHTDPSCHKTDTSAKLTHLLLTLDSTIPHTEAQHLANDIVWRSKVLEEQFDRSTSPWVHNFMVNVGLKQKGLCYQYADGLYLYLKQKKYPHFAFHLAGAHIGEYWREHNTLVVTAKNGRFKDGIVVDPWREEGKVFVSRLKDDKAYKWVHRPERGCQ